MIRDDANSCWHGIEYGLSTTASDEVRTGRCNACLFPHAYFKILRNEIYYARTGSNPRMCEEVAQDALLFVAGALEKFALYRDHHVRVANQQKAIDQLHMELKETCPSTKKDCTVDVLVVDWNNPTSARETTQEHFGKRGIGWHASLLYFYKYEEEEESADGVTRGVGRATVPHGVLRSDPGGIK